jgi:hypothetical protein
MQAWLESKDQRSLPQVLFHFSTRRASSQIRHGTEWRSGNCNPEFEPENKINKSKPSNGMNIAVISIVRRDPLL